MEITEEVLDIQIKAFEKKIEQFKEYFSTIDYVDEAQYLVEKMMKYEATIGVLKFQKGLLTDEKDVVETLNNMDKYATEED